MWEAYALVGGRVRTTSRTAEFDLHPDGQRFALQSTSETPAAKAPDTVIFITNFFDELRRLTAEGGSSEPGLPSPPCSEEVTGSP